MTTREVDVAEWELLELEWHGEHRTHPGLLRDRQRDYYLLLQYLERYGCHAVQALPFRFEDGLKNLGYD